MTDCELDNDAITCPHCLRPSSSRRMRRNCPRRPPYVPKGKPGYELTAIINATGLQKVDGCTPCNEMAARMDAWGPEGCRAHREEIIDHLHKAYKHTSWPEFFTAVRKLAASGQLPIRLTVRGALGVLVDEAIRRAEA